MMNGFHIQYKAIIMYNNNVMYYITSVQVNYLKRNSRETNSDREPRKVKPIQLQLLLPTISHQIITVKG